MIGSPMNMSKSRTLQRLLFSKTSTLNTWSCLKANLQLSVVVTSAHPHTHPALTCKMHGCPWDVMDGGGESTGVKKSLSLHPQGEKKEQIEDQNRDREKDGVKSRVKDEGENNQCWQLKSQNYRGRGWQTEEKKKRGKSTEGAEWREGLRKIAGEM